MIIKLKLIVLCISVMTTLVFTSFAQTCSNYSFSTNNVFTNCRDLPHQNSFLHWTYDQGTGKLAIAFRHGGMSTSSSSNRWVAWGINPKRNLNSAMLGAQALVAISQSNTGTPSVYTSSISNDYNDPNQLQQGTIAYNVTGFSATRQNDEIIIFATLTLPSGTTSLVHLWQEGPLSSASTPQRHPQDNEHFDSKEALDLLSGHTQAASTSGNSLRRKRNVHGVLNAVSWGIMLPIGAIISRYLKVFKSADPAWFYLHVICQTSAYVVGVGGWGYGLKLGSDSVGVEYSTHRTLGIIIFCLGTLQVFALFLRPNKEHKYRVYWNVYHHLVGYATIVISVVNIFEGFDALEESVGDRYDDWKKSYISIIAALGGIAVLLEVYTWIVVFKRRSSESVPRGEDDEGHASKTQQV
ncbi:cytochrome b561 and DOMON domain-containing protein [Senna tora]|uniref:Cytochrome b561 and DOMON domain-containing protein n=1 Tax=Senna tora TaxID=362788 RepID=A0A834W0A3_9FABA|nr:cytochrome b561 and DOMON domain-containing protein [Senna tora]